MGIFDLGFLSRAEEAAAPAQALDGAKRQRKDAW